MLVYQVSVQDFRQVLKEKCDEIIRDKKLSYELFVKLCEIEADTRIRSTWISKKDGAV